MVLMPSPKSKTHLAGRSPARHTPVQMNGRQQAGQGGSHGGRDDTAS
jgi:hypothetical protein